MQRKNLRFGQGFRIAIRHPRSQAAEMVLEPGDCEGSSTNFHRGSDQWLYVVEGTGTAVVNGKRHPLKKGTLVLIERGDRHEIRAANDSSLCTLNVYVPPAYRDNETPLPAGKPGS